MTKQKETNPPVIRDVTDEHDTPSTAMTAFDAAANAVSTTSDPDDDGSGLFEEPRDIRDLSSQGFVADKSVPMPRGKALTGIYEGPGPERAINGVKVPVRTWSIRKGNFRLNIHNAHGLEEFFTSTGPGAPKVGDTVYLYRALNDSTLPNGNEVSNFTCMVLRNS